MLILCQQYVAATLGAACTFYASLQFLTSLRSMSSVQLPWVEMHATFHDLFELSQHSCSLVLTLQDSKSGSQHYHIE